VPSSSFGDQLRSELPLDTIEYCAFKQPYGQRLRIRVPFGPKIEFLANTRAMTVPRMLRLSADTDQYARPAAAACRSESQSHRLYRLLSMSYKPHMAKAPRGGLDHVCFINSPAPADYNHRDYNECVNGESTGLSLGGTVDKTQLRITGFEDA